MLHQDPGTVRVITDADAKKEQRKKRSPKRKKEPNELDISHKVGAILLKEINWM
jgi:hypothetical protein